MKYSQKWFGSDCVCHMQVRQQLYNTSVGKWRQYAEQLQPAAAKLRPLIQKYEAAYAAYLPAAAPAKKDEL